MAQVSWTALDAAGRRREEGARCRTRAILHLPRYVWFQPRRLQGGLQADFKQAAGLKPDLMAAHYNPPSPSSAEGDHGGAQELRWLPAVRGPEFMQYWWHRGLIASTRRAERSARRLPGGAAPGRRRRPMPRTRRLSPTSGSRLRQGGSTRADGLGRDGCGYGTGPVNAWMVTSRSEQSAWNLRFCRRDRFFLVHLFVI